MKKIAITGYKGFIGSNLTSFLNKKGYDVIGIEADIRNKEALQFVFSFFKDIEFVIHTAGETKALDDEKLCYMTNVVGTQNIIDLCLEYGYKLIHLSSIARRQAYGRSKQKGQRLVERACLNNKLKAIILRLCSIVHKDDPLMKKGKRYSIEELVEDIENIIKNYNFNECGIFDYQYEKHFILLKF